MKLRAKRRFFLYILRLTWKKVLAERCLPIPGKVCCCTRQYSLQRRFRIAATAGESNQRVEQNGADSVENFLLFYARRRERDAAFAKAGEQKISRRARRNKHREVFD